MNFRKSFKGGGGGGVFSDPKKMWQNLDAKGLFMVSLATFKGLKDFAKHVQYDFPKMRGEGQRPFGTFPKIHPCW